MVISNVGEKMILCGTGHRPSKLPDKLTGYDYNNPTYQYIRKELIKILEELKPEKVISGMALGFDTVLAEIAIDLQIPFIAAVPFVGQERIWPQKSKDHYNFLLSKAVEVMIVCEGEYAAWKMQKRNEFMVQKSNIVIACFDGTKGGTHNCIEYAKSLNKEIIYIDPKNAK